MHRGALIAAICVSLSVQEAFGQEAIPITNVTVDMIRRGGRDNFRLDAQVHNPNDFAVFDVQVTCDIRDRRGRKLASYATMIVDAIKGRGFRIFRGLDTGAWPDQGKTAYCVSSEAKRLPN